MVTAVIIGGIICVAIAVAGGTAQSLKTTYIIGGTPKNVQIGMYLGIVAGDALMGIIVAGFATAGIDLGFGAKLFKGLAVSNEFSIIIFSALALWIYMFATKVDKTVF